MRKFFRTTLLLQSITVVMVTALVFTPVVAQGPFNALRTILKPVEADPNKDYVLTEMDGPYLIFAAAFSGPNAKQDAHSLVLELRKNHKWNAFVYEKTFTFDVKKDFKQAANPYTKTTAKYMNSGSGTEFAVLIGNFSSLDDKQLDKTLAEVRQCQPASLKGKASPTPFSMAFPLANPLLPPETQRGVVDDFVVSLNKDRPYSLLRNPGRYTVQIATFTGSVMAKTAELDKLAARKPQKTDLEKGEQAAVALCKALREQRVEAYEFHDRYTSIVTVGSFDQQHLRRAPDGTVILDPQIIQIMQQYQAKKEGNSPAKIVVVNGIECDPLPVLIEVPRLRR